MARTKSKHKFGMALSSSRKPRGKDRLSVVGRLWIEKDDQTVFSWSRAMLLDGIDKHRSISAAAREMNMSYPKAWRLVKEMNERFETPLVIKKAGGKSGGEAELTKKGKDIRDRFWKLVDDFSDWLDQERF